VIENIKAGIIEALKLELPGESAHRLLLPAGRELYPVIDRTTILQSSVLLLLFPHHGKICTCFIRRPSNMRHHGGQIAFPGGRYELRDKDLIHTALRESHEEIGTESEQIEILGGLTPLYVEVSNFTINPFVGWTGQKPNFVIDNREVEEVFVVPIEKLQHHSATQMKTVTTSHGTLDVPGFYNDELFIWGATAMVLSEFNEVYKLPGTN